MSDIAFDLATNLGSVTAASLTAAHVVGGGVDRALVVGVVGDTATDFITGVTYNGVAMTLVRKNAASGSNRWLYTFLLLNPTSGSNNVIVSASSATFIAAQAASYANVRPIGGVDSSIFGSSTGITTLTVNTTTVADRCWLVGFFKLGTATALGAGASTTSRINDGSVLAMLADSNAAKSPAGLFGLQATSTGAGDIGGIVLSLAPSPSTGLLEMF